MTLERWQRFSKHDQLLHVASAIMRASNWQNKDWDKFILALKEAMSLIELSLRDQRWSQYFDALKYLKNRLEEHASRRLNEDLKLLYKTL